MTRRTRSSSSIGRRLRWRGLLRKEQGSFTIEAAFVMPVLFLFILLFILFGMYMYQKMILYYSAGVTAERAAFGWDNSRRDPRTGIAEPGQYDGLYWRIGEDNMLESVFGLHAGEDSASVDIPGSNDTSGGEEDLALYKLARASQWLGDAEPAFQGQAGYVRGALKRSVQVKLKEPIVLEPLERMLGKSEPKAAATAGIVDPVELIRSVDLTRYYASKFASGGFGRQEAGQVLATYAPKPPGSGKP